MRTGWLAALVLCLGGCTSTVDEKFAFYNQDGAQLFRAGNYQRARESFQAALEIKPNDLEPRFNLAACYDRLGENDYAEKLYRDCLRRSPNHASAQHALAALLVREGRLTTASEQVHDWMTREPHRATPYAEEAYLLREQRDLPLAQARLQQALALDPHDIRALIELGRVYEACDRPDRALVLYERVIKIAPDQAEVAAQIAALRKRGVKQPHPD